MYSTLDGAKKCAKQLKRLLSDSGLIYPLAKCQAVVAKAGGYRDWYDLSAHIGSGSNPDLPYDYWGKLITVLPQPCHFPVKAHLHGTGSSSDAPEHEQWIRAILPYVLSMEVVHRGNTAVLRPGSGKDQKLRLEIISGMLLNIDGHNDFAPRLDPENLTIVMDGPPASIVPQLAGHPRFDEAVQALIDAAVLKVEGQKTCVLAPNVQTLREEVVERARSWNARKETEIEYIPMSDELAAGLKRQIDIDRAEAGPKVPYNELDHRGILLQSRFSVASEFDTMKSVVDVMPDDVRLRILSIWCDSRACADYRVDVRLGMHRNELPERIKDCFLAGSEGFNGLGVWHGSDCTFFESEWPADEAYYAQLAEG